MKLIAYKKPFILAIILAFFSSGIIAQTVTVVPTPTFCEGDGSATFTVRNATVGATLDFILYKLPDTGTPYRITSMVEVTASTVTHIEDNLQQGTYRVQVVQNFEGDKTERILPDFTVGNNFTGITAQNITITGNQVCGGRTIVTVNVSGNGRPARYALRDLNNQTIFPFQESPTFPDPMVAGKYRLLVEDICGNITSKDVDVTVITSIVEPYSIGAPTFTSCNAIEFSQRITGRQGGASSSSYIRAYQYPVELDIEVKNTVTGEIIYQSQNVIHNQAEANAGIPIRVEDFNPGDQITITATTTDACGEVSQPATRTIHYNPTFTLNAPTGECGARYLRIYNINYYYNNAETTVTFTKYPDEFKPWEYNDDFADGEYSHTYNTLPEAYTSGSEIHFGGFSQPVPEGEYEVTITNECGVSVTRQVTVTPPTLNSFLYATTNPDCEEGWHYIRFYYQSAVVNIVKVVVTEAPQAFIDLHGPLPFDASEYITTYGDNRTDFRMRVPEGSYTFVVTNSCGQEHTQSVSVRKKVELLSHEVSYTRYCGGYFTLTASAKISNTEGDNRTGYYLQKWYPELGAWGHPQTGVTGDVSDPNTRMTIGNNNATQYYVHGDLRVIAIPMLAIWGTGGGISSTTQVCPAKYFELERFTIPPGSIALNNYYTIGCENGAYNLLLDATGVGELRYEIIQKDGQPFSVNNGSSPVFTGLPAGEYTVRVTDLQCGDALTANLKVVTNKLPAIKAQELCEGDPGRLYVNGASYLTVEWYKNGVNTGVTGHVFQFNPYNPATDNGIYEARLSYPSNPNWCTNSNTTLHFNLNPDIINDAKAGNGQTVTLSRSDFPDGLVNLFDYLEGEYHLHGEWTDMGNTGFLLGNEWYIKNISGGTYQFKYRVEGTCSSSDETIVTIHLTGTNYWHGTIDNDWDKTGNWTANFVPGEGDDVEFATSLNNGPLGDGNGAGPAKNDLHLGEGKVRIIGSLTNNSDMDLIVSLEGMLTINGEVEDTNNGKGTIVVKADAGNKKTSGTLYFTPDPSAPDKNRNVQATVEFYNKAYECDNCGFYRKQWQYFGIPVQSAVFPATGNEIVNQWSEPVNGNKWITPTSPMQAFKGYEITNTAASSTPTHIYDFNGLLNVGNASVILTKTPLVNYSGANLLGNSYTAAIPIGTGFSFSSEVVDKAVYLFNTGTRDQWRKLNGSTTSGVAGGQYLAVPFELAGQEGLPAVIPSMHSFMIFADKVTTLIINYETLEQNQLVKDVAGNEIATRSAVNGPVKATSAIQQLPVLIMDAVGKTSADRVWIFNRQGTTHSFDSGWDGRKMEEDGITQLYVSASDNSKLQVATVPDMKNVSLGFIPDSDGRYTLEFSLSGQLKNAEIYLHDEVTKAKERIHDGGSYSFDAKKGETPNRFRLAYTATVTQLSPDEELIDVTAITDGKIKIVNRSNNDCSAFISGTGAPRERIEVKAGGEETVEGLDKGIYIIRLQNAEVTDVRRVTIK